MADKTHIINIALTELGADPITDPKQETENAKFAAARFDTAMATVLALHPWNCAICRATVPAESTGPEFGFANSFPLPKNPECFRVIEVNDNEEDWQVEGQRILTNEVGPLFVKYIGKITVDRISPLLAEVIGLKLASGIAYRITKSRSRTESMRVAFEQALREARSADAQEGTPQSLRNTSSILAARR